MLDDRRKTQVINAVRKAARDCILPRFRQLAVADVSTKSGPGDLVTLADTEAEAQITAEIGALWPEAVVLGEEAVAADPANRDRMARAEWAVIIDPVDGTWNYAKGLATFGVILSVWDALRSLDGRLDRGKCRSGRAYGRPPWHSHFAHFGRVGFAPHERLHPLWSVPCRNPPQVGAGIA